ncbi:MAG: AsmA family protein [Blastocatellia bacterium]|nr:AsmA family protein [Blastocatellia bacterium]
MKTVQGNSLRASKWFKPAIIAGGVIVLLLLGLLAIPLLIDINTYRGQIAAQLEKTLGRPVQLGAMKLRVLPSIKVAVEQVRIGEDPKFAQGDFVTARAVRLQMGLMSLLKGAPEVSGIELDEPAIVLIRQPDAQWNWSTLKPLQSTEAQSSQPPFDLRVQNGKFTMIDRSVTPPTEKSYTGVNIALEGFSPQRAFDAVISLTMPGENGGKFSIEGEAGPIDRADAARTPIDARIRMESVDLASLESMFGDGAAQGAHAGRLTSDVKVAGRLADGLTASGSIKAEQLRLVSNVEPAKTPLEAEFALKARSEKNAAGESAVSMTIDQCQVRVGGTKADIAGRIDRLPAQPAIDLQLKGDRVSLESLLESAYAFGFGPPAGTKAGGAATFDLRASGDAQSLAINGRAEIQDLKFQNSSMPQPMTVSELKLTFTPNEVTAAPFRATLSRTTVDLSNLKVSDYSKQGRAHLDVSTSNAQLEDLVKIAESFGARPGVAATAGSASLKAAIDANLGGTARAMNINGSGKLTGARLQTAGAAKPIEIANADLGFTGDSLRVDNLAMQFGGSQINGWLQMRDFDRPNATFDLKANQLSLAEMQQSLGSSSGSAGAAGGGTSAMTATGQISIGKLLLDTITATDVQSKVTLVNQVLTLDPMTLKLYGGAYQGSVRVNSASAAPEIALNGNFNGLDINQFLSASGQRSSIYGRANGAINVRGQGDGSSDGLARSLVGNGAIAINDGKFASFDLMKQVEVLGKLYNLPTGGAGTAFRSLKTNLVFERGRMRTDALQILMDDLQVNGGGAIQLGDAPTIDYDLIVKLSQGLTKRVSAGGGGAAGLLAGLASVSSKLGNFFADSDSTLAIPIKMSGPLKQPVFGLNSAILQQRAKTRLTERLVEGFTKDAGKEPAKEPGKEPAKEPAKPKPVDLLKGVLEGLKRKEKPQ